MDLSIIIPIYNSDKWLEKTLQCYFSQEYESVEYILIDDGSTDHSLEICNNYKEKHNNVTIIQQLNKGVSSARNAGLREAKGKYISFLDSDDYIDSEMLSDMMKIAVENELDVVSCGISMELEIKGKRYVHSQIKYGNEIRILDKLELREHMLSMWEKSIPFNIWNKIYKKKLLYENNIEFSELNLGEDLEFNMRVFRVCHNLGIIPKCYYHYIRDRSGSATSKYIPNWFTVRKNEHAIIKSFFRDYLECTTIPKEYEEYIARRFVIRSLACIENECKRKKSRKEKIKAIVTDPELQECLRKAQKYSGTIKIMIIPIKYKLCLLVTFEGIIIGIIRNKYPRIYEILKYNKT